MKKYRYTIGTVIIMCVLIALGVISEMLLHNQVAMTAVIFIVALGAILVLRVLHEEQYLNNKMKMRK